MSSFGQRPAGRLRQRVLLLTSQLPGPTPGGSRRRGLEMARRLSGHFDLHLLVVSDAAPGDPPDIAALYEYCREVEILPATPRWGGHDALEWDEPRQVARLHSERATGRVGEILARQSVDLIHVEGFGLMQHVPDWVDVPVLLLEPSVEYDVERQRVSAHGHPLLDLQAFRDCVKTRDTELECWSRASMIGAVRSEDRDLIAAASPGADVRLIADGADHVPHLRALGSINAPERPAAPLLTLRADFACRPDADAAVRFGQEILPLIRSTVPDTHLWLVGEHPGDEIHALASETVRVTGVVSDVVPFVDAADVIVCPFNVGGAVKAGASEALRRGKAAVSTSVAAQGLPGAARAALAVADDPEAFAAEVTSLLVDSSRRAELERVASSVATLLPRWDQTAAALGEIYDELLNHRGILDRHPAGHAGAGLSA